MISREAAIKTLKDYWSADKFVFQADFHVPKNIKLREGSKPFGYFRNFRHNGEIIDFPIIEGATYDRRVSIKYTLKEGLIADQLYEVEVELNKEAYRSPNPFSLRVKRFKKLVVSSTKSENQGLEDTINEIFQEKISIGSPFTMVELANSVESLATDIYSENKRFIYELIQNADDAALDDNAELSIDLLENYVVISHDGAPFDSRDIRGLCSIGIGTKSDDASKTGYKGIGFKSVFGQPDGLVYVKTGNTLFRFDRDYVSKKGWNTKWGDQNTWEIKNRIEYSCPWQMMPILSESIDDPGALELLNRKDYSVKTAIRINDRDELYNDIVGLFEDAKFMLFLRKIKSVHLNNGDKRVHLDRFGHDQLSDAVTLSKNGLPLSNWYLKNWAHKIPSHIQADLKSDLKTPKKIQTMEKVEISFAIKLNTTLCEIELLSGKESPMYSYLPTSETEFNFPFIVNSNFLLDAGREKIHKNRIWNEWLFQVIGYKSVQCCAELAENNLFGSTYLSLLRNGYYPSFGNLGGKINAGLKMGFDQYPFISNRKGGLSKLHEVCLDPYDLNQIDSSAPKHFAEFLTKSLVFKLKGKNVIRLSESNKVLKNFEPKELNDQWLQDFIASKELGNLISKENNFKLLEFLRLFEENDPSGKWYIVVTKQKLIINQEDELDYIKGVCFPMEVTTANTGNYKNVLIHQSVYNDIKKDNALLAWLERLGVTEPGSIAFLEKEIIAKIDSCVSEENYLDLTKFIFELHSAGKLEDDHYINLQEFPLKTSSGLKKANQCILPAAYNPTINFSEVLGDADVISEAYLRIADVSDCREFFKLLNARDDVDFIKSSKKFSSELNPQYVKDAYSFSKEGHSYPHLIGVFHPNDPIDDVPFYMQTFSFLDVVASSSVAELFWERLFNKFQLKKDKSGEIGGAYEEKKEYIEYHLGNNQVLRSVDLMSWGRFPNNKTFTIGYIFWCMENIKCIPTSCGMTFPRDAFANTLITMELVGDFLPVIKLKETIPEDWRNLLKLKTRPSLSDLLIVLEKIATLVRSKGSLNKENEKRIGLIYNELATKLENDREKSLEDIKNWGRHNQLISASGKSIATSDLLWIKIPGFENVSAGFETIFLPRNVDSKNLPMEDLITAFGVKVIEEFSFQANNQTEFFDLKIKLLKLIGPMGLLLKQKLQISDLDRFLYDRYQKISKTSFFRCESISPVFVYGSKKIEGETVLYSHNRLKEEFLISIDWQKPISLLNISYELSRLMAVVKVEKELMMLLSLRSYQVREYLIGLGLDPSEYDSCSSFTEISSLVKELEEVKASVNQLNSKPPETKSTNLDLENISEDILNEPSGVEDIESEENTDSAEVQKRIEYSEEEMDQLKQLFGRELGDSELEEENLYAQVKALRYFKDNDYDITQAELDFLDNYEDKYLAPIIDENGNSYQVMCRSARRGILFFGAYPWTNLSEENTWLYVLTGDQSNDCILIKNQEELEEKLHSEFKVLRRKNTAHEELKRLIDSESELSELELLYKVKDGNFDVIFNPRQNEPGETEGPLEDIGIDV